MISSLHRSCDRRVYYKTGARNFFVTLPKYFDGLEEVQSSNESYDEKKATELWESSAKLVKLSPREVRDSVSKGWQWDAQ